MINLKIVTEGSGNSSWRKIRKGGVPNAGNDVSLSKLATTIIGLLYLWVIYGVFAKAFINWQAESTQTEEQEKFK